MRQFFKYVFATIIGLVLTFLIFLLVFSAIIGIATKDKTKAVAANSVLHLNLNYAIPEKTSENPFESIDFASFENKQKLGLNDILKCIKSAETDDDIKGIYIEMSGSQSGFTTIKAIRDALRDFKESDKFVIAYGENIAQRAYYLGSVADEVYMNPKGYVDFRGLGVQAMFLKGTLDKLGIEIEVFKTGEYKSAAESLTRENFSEDNKIQIEEFVGDVHDLMLADVAQSRKETTAKLQQVANGILARMPSGAKSHNIIDDAKYFDEVIDIMKERVGIEKDEKIPFVSLSDYNGNVKKSRKSAKDKIAIIYASGNIVDGEGEENQVDSRRFAKVIRKIRKNEKIKGVVVRVNSPGGSALASEVIWRELKLTQEEKPVVVSMGDVAASGGYYISCNADKIFAEPSTVTGSIGVIGAIPNMEAFFNSKLGITFDEIEMAEYSVFGGGAKPLSESEKLMIQEGIDSVYLSFKTRVSKGRNIPLDLVDSLAGGRIYSGMDALDLNLIDEFGNMNDAIDEVVEMAGLESYRTVNYPRSKNPFEQFMSSMSGETRAKSLVKSEMGEYYDIYNTISTMKNWNPVQARLLFDLEVK